MCHSRTPGGLEELPGDVEAHIPVLVSGPAAGELTEGGAEPVGEVQLERVPSGSLFKTDPDLADVGSVSRYSRYALYREVHGRPHADSRSKADEHCVVVIDEWGWQKIGIVNPDGLDIHRGKIPDRTRDNCPQRRRMAITEIVGAFGACER